MVNCPGVGIPSWLPDEIEGVAGSRGYYFASLTPRGQPVMRRSASIRSAAAFLRQLGTGAGPMSAELAAAHVAKPSIPFAKQRSASLPTPEPLLPSPRTTVPAREIALVTSLSSDAALSDADVGMAGQMLSVHSSPAAPHAQDAASPQPVAVGVAARPAASMLRPPHAPGSSQPHPHRHQQQPGPSTAAAACDSSLHQVSISTVSSTPAMPSPFASASTPLPFEADPFLIDTSPSTPAQLSMSRGVQLGKQP